MHKISAWQVPIQDYGEGMNVDLADRFAIGSDEFPVFYLFPRNSPQDEAVLYGCVVNACPLATVI